MGGVQRDRDTTSNPRHPLDRIPKPLGRLMPTPIWDQMFSNDGAGRLDRCGAVRPGGAGEAGSAEAGRGLHSMVRQARWRWRSS